MIAKIEIDCEDIRELKLHLMEMLTAVEHKRCELKNELTDELPVGTIIQDINCYGTHLLEIVED